MPTLSPADRIHAALNHLSLKHPRRQHVEEAEQNLVQLLEALEGLDEGAGHQPTERTASLMVMKAHARVLLDQLAELAEMDADRDCAEVR
jgi:hypothetical protein